MFNWLFQSSSVAEAAYQCNWYLFNAKAKRGLTLLIMNSQQGISMCGAGIVVMDNRVIVKVIHHHGSNCSWVDFFLVDGAESVFLHHIAAVLGAVDFSFRKLLEMDDIKESKRFVASITFTL